MEIADYMTIPSTTNLAKLDAISYEELRLINEKVPSFDFTHSLDDNDPEASIKTMLPQVTEVQAEYPKEDVEKDRVGLRVVDFAESYDYSSTNYAQIFHYYALLERIFKLELFRGKMGANLLDSLKLEQCVLYGLPFWGVDLNEEYNSGNNSMGT